MFCYDSYHKIGIEKSIVQEPILKSRLWCWYKYWHFVNNTQPYSWLHHALLWCYRPDTIHSQTNSLTDRQGGEWLAIGYSDPQLKTNVSQGALRQNLSTDRQINICSKLPTLSQLVMKEVYKSFHLHLFVLSLEFKPRYFCLIWWFDTYEFEVFTENID